MKKIFTRVILALFLVSGLFFTGCSKVPAGNVGVKFYMLGGDKGIDHEILKPGKYWIGMNEELYLFPTFTQNYIWTKSQDEGSPTDESITFQDKEGLPINADIGITFSIDPDKVPILFQKYKKGIDEIRSIYLRNMVRDALVLTSSTLAVDQIYGPGKADFIKTVENKVRDQCAPMGILIDKIYLSSDMRLPNQILQAINDKMASIQKAQQREFELREAEAAAKKVVAAAEGQAKANDELMKSITPTLIQWEAIKKWDGKLPQVSGGGALPFINIK